MRAAIVAAMRSMPPEDCFSAKSWKGRTIFSTGCRRATPMELVIPAPRSQSASGGKQSEETTVATHSMRRRPNASSPLIAHEPVDRSVDIALAPGRRCIGHHRENIPGASIHGLRPPEEGCFELAGSVSAYHEHRAMSVPDHRFRN